MAEDQTPPMDTVDAELLSALQEDGRLSIAELSRRVHMSTSAVGERVRRLEDRGVIRGYTADVDPEKLGYPILAYLRLRYPSSNYKPLHDVLDTTPEVVEAHHVTGDDCFIIKVLAVSMRDLERISGRIGALGSVTTSVAYSSPIPRRAIVPPSIRHTV
ncbi:Lrp/AsnC family transcriptional regulator [Rhodococcus sp. BGS-1C]|uniref:Lrp/AsnC family transcriptional regulator n=1 Tax=unclassified Rhodococcus (in: high G+C Gram-positive bacteria) TaxID=192944 RepID=UPI0019D0ADDA|nr:Lrp/AsnC family transcriptional regulator [Rhodococcus sp. KRD197]